MSSCLPMFLSAALLAAAPSRAPSPAASPAPTASKTTYVIVHGAWGGGWDWRKVDDLLSAGGATVFRPTLTGLGARVHLATREIGLTTHVTDVVNEILFEGLRDVVLVGHSYGGMVISGVAEKVPERIRGLVYLDAVVPEDGESIMGSPRSAGGLLRGMVVRLRGMMNDGFLIPPWVSAGQPVPKDVPQPARTFTEPIVLKNEAARRVPATYILTMEKGAVTDDFSPHAERARSRGWTIVQMEADHNPQRTMPEALVKILREIR